MSSDSRVFVIDISAREKHPNADNLDIVMAFGGYPVICNRKDWEGVTKAAYIPIDMVVPNKSEFSFLGKEGKLRDKDRRIRAKRLRGVFSMGLLIPAPDGSEVGDDVTEILQITKYEPEEHLTGARPGCKFLPGDSEPDPGYIPFKYDIENIRKYYSLLKEGEEVILTEKTHGANALYLYRDGRLWVRSRQLYKKPDVAGLWADLAKKYNFEKLLKEIEGIALFGEVYGQVQDLKYGLEDTDFVAFDAYNTNKQKFLDYDEFISVVDKLNEISKLKIKTAPMLYRGPWISLEHAKSFAEGPTVVGNGACVREGFVLRVPRERFEKSLGRFILKLHGEGFLLR